MLALEEDIWRKHGTLGFNYCEIDTNLYICHLQPKEMLDGEARKHRGSRFTIRTIIKSKLVFNKVDHELADLDVLTAFDLKRNVSFAASIEPMCHLGAVPF